MRHKQPNRRIRRSDDVHEALRLQLAASAQRARFSAFVLADELGTVIAATGDNNIGEEMAAVSPILAPGIKPWHGTVPSNKGDVSLSIAPIKLDDSKLYLTAADGRRGDITRELFTSGRGVTRILA